ncbi:probable fumarylacetoacetate hydrolase domain-containing protein 2 [Rhynchosporium agropyri]|uniref:Probable fumarylacetoacetate hydrolase domain-containing protein 2 n=1 Tax=Rhynchosporium agropyri TaxID=914238 RepID=A0A1E1KA47_9HELO|nr:probable fumarylacetoacetate hydrolase domain-containing protein 2 [Rhynchosporium agropyri]
MPIPSFGRLVRFVPKSGSGVLIGEPTDKNLDIGAATLAGKDVEVSIFSGSSVLSPGSSTGKTEVIGRVLSPLAESEVGTIRCIGLNYVQHAREAKMALPDVPVLFTKPSTALADPYPAPTIIPKHTLKDDSCDYESELVIVIGRKCKNVIEAEVLEYVLGYTASNDVSSRTSQFAQSQWSFSKGFDGACPIGPVIVSKELIPNVGKLHLRGLKNGRVMQDCGLDDLIFSVPKIVSFLSQGTTLNPGTIILTGTPAGVGFGFTPKEYLYEGDEFAVEILPYIGTLVTRFEAEK